MTIRLMSIIACTLGILLSGPSSWAQSAQSRATDKAVETNVNQALEKTPAHRKHVAASKAAAAEKEKKAETKPAPESAAAQVPAPR